MPNSKFSFGAYNWLVFAIPLTIFVVWFLVEQSNKLVVPEGVLVIDKGFSLTENRNVRLPHTWQEQRSHPRQHDYQFEFLALPNQASSSTAWSIYLPHVEQNVILKLNDQRLPIQGDISPYPSRYSVVGLILDVPDGLLIEGRNALSIQLHSYPDFQGYLGPALIGPSHALRPIYNQAKIVHYDLLWFFGAMGMVIAGAVAIISGLRPHEPIYRSFAWILLLWNLHMFGCLVINSAIATPWIHTWTAILACSFCAACYIFTLQLTQPKHRMMQLAVMTFAGLICLLLIIITAWRSSLAPTLSPLAIGTMLIVGIPSIYLLLIDYHRHRDPEIAIYIYSGVVMLVFGVFTLAIAGGSRTTVGGQHLFYLTPVLLSVVGFLLGRRYITALRNSEQLTLELEARIEQKTLELDASYHEMLRLEQEQARLGERERIMRDMHDGVGAYLVSGLMQLRKAHTKPAELETTLTTALLDLRLMIDSLDSHGGELNAALGMLRQRLEPELNKLNTQFRWQVDALPALPALGSAGVLHVLRILQEAITNALKHSDGDEIELSATLVDGSIHMQVTDNGTRSMATDNGDIGKGLKNMMHRAEVLQAHLEWGTNEIGNWVLLILPLGVQSSVGEL